MVLATTVTSEEPVVFLPAIGEGCAHTVMRHKTKRSPESYSSEESAQVCDKSLTEFILEEMDGIKVGETRGGGSEV